jgi:hypothetical protein
MLTFPMHDRLVFRLNGRHNLASIISCLCLENETRNQG